ncbi:hydroxyisourate hydrolase [Planomonospora venezuelensis]|uniref:5-hydroxyisourate hydrolase n=1 Tax=Planomonospora venezuelensis TaxID=1999 RepID=A0A841D0J4_PLAVE|nr:hydroxyisourate hydrolase [Planomonospora venezuelensis]MBB5961817.1 5-hydroxyisourate hydrolase [Planomonospora venezuelensis]GIM99115.1 5-hydroxyisourate hydrolase [Planomonospora venezuelensis]
MSLSTHVLDAALGRPAAGVAVRLESGGTVVAEGRTDADGRLSGWSPGAGVHRLVFGTGDYFAARGVAAFYPEVAVAFTIDDPDEHYHVPLLLSPFAYSTYRGS